MPDEDLASNAWEENALQALYYAFGESDEEGQKLFLNMVLQSYYPRPSFLSKIFHQIREIQEEDIFEVSKETLAWVSFWEGYENRNKEKNSSQIKKLKNLAEKETLEDLNRGALFFQLGLMEGELGNDAKACQYYKHATQFHYSFAWTHNNWGASLANLGRHKDAIEKFRQTLEHDPNNVMAYNNWGTSLGNLKRYDDAIEKFRQTLKRDPTYVKAYHNWGIGLANLGRHEEALEKYQQAIERDPKYVDNYYNWGNSLAGLGRYEEAIEKFRQAIKRDTNRFNAYNGWGYCLDNLGRHEDAIEKFEQVLKLDPDNAYAKEQLKRIRETSQ